MLDHVRYVICRRESVDPGSIGDAVNAAEGDWESDYIAGLRVVIAGFPPQASCRELAAASPDHCRYRRGGREGRRWSGGRR